MNRQIIRFIAVGIVCCLTAIQAEEKFWSDNKLTSAQAFPGRICAVATLWPGYDLLIEEIGGNRICLARVWIGHLLKYSVLDPAKVKTKEDPKCLEANKCWTCISPAIDADRFTWSIGSFRIGRIFGDEDVLQKVAAQQFQTK